MEKFVFNEVTVPIEKVRPNTWNPKDSLDESEINHERFETIKRMMSEHGQMATITVRWNPKDGSDYEIIDGYHRWRAASELGWKQVRVNNLGEIDDTKAKALTIMFERAKVETNPTKEAQLIAGMYEILPSFDELSKLLPYSPQVIKDKVELVDFNWDKFNKEGEPVENQDAENVFHFKVSPEDAELCHKALSFAGEENLNEAFVTVCQAYLQKHDMAGDEEDDSIT